MASYMPPACRAFQHRSLSSNVALNTVKLEAIQAGRDGNEARRVWLSLSELIETTWREVHECHALVLEHGPVISDTRPPHELLVVVEEIIHHSEAGNSFGLLTKLTKRHWFEFR